MGHPLELLGNHIRVHLGFSSSKYTLLPGEQVV